MNTQTNTSSIGFDRIEKYDRILENDEVMTYFDTNCIKNYIYNGKTMSEADIMIKRITVSNFKSFKDMEFDFTSKNKVLNYAVVYGENGSGKTNLVQTVSFLKESINTLSALGSGASADLSDLCRICRTNSSTGPMVLSYEMRFDGDDVAYSMRFDGDILVEEEMTGILNKRRGTLFRIRRNDSGIEKIFWSSLFADSGFRKGIEKDVERFWGRHSFLSIINHHMQTRNTDTVDDSISKIGKIIREIRRISTNTSIVDSLSESDYPFLDNLETGNVRRKDLEALNLYGKALRTFFRRIHGRVLDVRYELEATEDPDVMKYHLVFFMKNDGDRTTVRCVDESSGTRKIVSFFRMLIDCVSERTVFIDEIDNGIHDKMLYGILEQVLPELNGQMIMTTHDTGLIKLISPKNSFVIDVDSEGFKDFRSFSSVRRTMTNNNNQERYLNNAFGGVPFIGSIGLSDIASELRAELERP